MLKAFQKICCCTLFGISSVVSAEPVAVVEDISTNSAGVEIMDFLAAGQVINLAKDDTIVLGYMLMCVRETIKGGKITIGEEQSKVVGGSIVTEEVECSGSQTNLDGQVAAQSGAVTFRNGPNTGLASIEIELFGTAPVFILEQPGKTVIIKRIDKQEQPKTITISGKYLDTHKQNLQLVKGAAYSVESSDNIFKRFKINDYASDKPVAVISRMVRLP